MVGVVTIMRCCGGVAGIVAHGGGRGDAAISNELSGEIVDKVDKEENEESDDDDSESDSTWVESGLRTRGVGRTEGV